MPSRRKADDADALGIDAPLLGLAAHQADGALRILEWAPSRVFTWDVVGAAWHPVLEQDAGYADRIEPSGNFLTLKLPPEVVVAASRANQHRRPCALVLRGAIDRDGRLRDISDELSHLDSFGTFLVGLRREFSLLTDRPRLLGCLAWPQLHD